MNKLRWHFYISTNIDSKQLDTISRHSALSSEASSIAERPDENIIRITARFPHRKSPKLLHLDKHALHLERPFIVKRNHNLVGGIVNI